MLKRYSFVYFVVLMVLSICRSFAQTPTNASAALAPILVGPYDGKDVSENQIVWTWFMQPTTNDGSEIICDLKVVEVLDGQTTEEAQRLNPPIVFKEDLRTSAWQTNFAARNFVPGHRYAWRIIAKRLDKLTQRETVVSESEIWSLSYNPMPVTAPTDGTTPLTTTAVDTVASLAPDASNTSSIQNPDSVHVETVSTTPQTETSSQGPKAISVRAQARITAEHNGNTFLTQKAQKDILRCQVDPSLIVFGVPFDAKLLVTTEQNIGKSEVSRGTFGSQNTAKSLNLALHQRLEESITELERSKDSASVDSLRQFVALDSASLAARIQRLYEFENKDLTENLEALKEIGIATEQQELVAQFPAFGFGKVAPQFSRFLFNGVTINGGLLEYNPGMLYAAGAVGKVQRTVELSGFPQESFQQDSILLSNVELFKNVYSGRIGYGRRNGNNLILTVLHSVDDAQSDIVRSLLNRPLVSTRIEADSSVTRDTVAHPIIGTQRNSVIGLVTHLSLDSSSLIIDGEFNISYLNDRDAKLWSRTDPLVGIRSASALETMFNPTEHELFDFNYATKLSYRFAKGTGRFQAGMRYVGAGFQSVGIAAVRKDVERFDSHYDQSFLGNQIRFIGGYSFEIAGFKQDKFNQSNLQSIHSLLEFHIASLPVIQFSLTHHAQTLQLNKNGFDTLNPRSEEKNRILQISASASYVYASHGSFRSASFLTFAYQDGQTTKADAVVFTSPGTFISRLTQLSQQFVLSQYVSLGFIGSYTSTESSDNHPTRVLSFDASCLVSPFAALPVTLGFVQSQNLQESTSTLGFYLETRYAVLKSTDLNFRLDSRSFQNESNASLQPTGFDGLLARFITSVHL